MSLRYEWTNEKDAMRSALRTLNEILLSMKKIEEGAKTEATIVKNILDTRETNELDTTWLIDALHQASIDYQANKPGME